MINSRVIPVLLLKNRGLVKTEKFKKETYLGDPLNTVKIFNEKEVDEIVILDILNSKDGNSIRYNYIEEIVSECFMPVAYGGGISKTEEIRILNKIGVEKVIINTHALLNENLLEDAVHQFGSSTIVVSVDVKKNLFGKYVIYSHSGTKAVSIDLWKYLEKLNNIGIGELILNSIDKDGTMSGYDLDLIKKASNILEMPLIACGGAGTSNDFKLAVDHGASAVAAGSLFVFHGKHKGILINYPTQEEITNLFN